MCFMCVFIMRIVSLDVVMGSGMMWVFSEW